MNVVKVTGFDNYSIAENGEVTNLSTGKVLKHSRLNSGYLRVVLYNNGYKAFSVHRLIATHFILNPENKPFINHINGIKDDNRVENLEWCTAKENSIHAVSIGAIPSGSRCRASKLNEYDIFLIKGLILARVENRDIAKLFKISRSLVKNIKYGKGWEQVKCAADKETIQSIFNVSPKTMTKRTMISAMRNHKGLEICKMEGTFVLKSRDYGIYGFIGNRLANNILKNKDLFAPLMDISELKEILNEETINT